MVPDDSPMKPTVEIEFDAEFTLGASRPKRKTILIATPNNVTGEYFADALKDEKDWTLGIPREQANLREIVERGDVDLAVVDESWMDEGLVEAMKQIGPSEGGTRFCVVLSGATELEALSWMQRGAAAFFHEPLAEVPADTVNFVIKSIFRTLPLKQSDFPRIEFRNPTGNWIEMTAPSNPGALEQFQRFFAMLHSTELTDEEKRMIHLSINEIGMNAIEWGNKRDENRKFRVSYAFFPDRILIRIEDEGGGFEPKEIPDPTKNAAAVMKWRKAQGKRMGGYGLALVRNIMDHVEFNARGNVVYMEKKLKLSGRQRSVSPRLIESGGSPISSGRLAKLIIDREKELGTDEGSGRFYDAPDAKEL